MFANDQTAKKILVSWPHTQLRNHCDGPESCGQSISMGDAT